MSYVSGRISNGLTKMLLAGLVSLAAVPLTTLQAQDNPFDQFPLLIQCKYKDTYHAFYISRISADGVATYMASERIAGTITLDGHAKATGGAEGGSCVGKTLEELRASGQAFDFKR
ncbi:hypothetical protein FHX08_004082 [Rhizobium sp. BK529]|uniref:hypothetical protein n=1 Tax=unclassified Rhizobium TaxID=2613769 RepID=UPI00104C58D6|nr:MULTISPECIES: hypothetical protein [unclassified Rhizobium]MBB3593679.1 hypothetical protein [Rhizobium sp. BK529]TCS03467.1 hypothetical protein EV281_104550 [Rhizobium sp. BK418]